MKHSPFILHDKSKITNCATTSCGEGSGEGKNTKKGEGNRGESFTRISLCDNRLGLNGEEVKAKIKKTADARVRAREQNSPNATAPLHNRSAQNKACPKRANKNSHLSTLFIEKTRHKHTHTTKNRFLVKKVQQKEVAANILFKEKLYFRKKTDHLLALRSFGGAIPLTRSRNSPRSERRNETMPFFNPSIHPDT